MTTIDHERASVDLSRYFIIVMAVSMQLCLGATYAWSVFVRSVHDLTGLGQGLCQVPFWVFYSVFPGTMLISGGLVSKLGPRRCAVLGGAMFGGGWILASMGHLHFSLTIIGIGLLGGIGVGFAYLVPIAVCVQWFPRSKGLVAGIALAGFGGGAAIVSQVAGHCMLTYHTTAFEMFRILGMFFLVVVVLAGATMRFPPSAPGFKRETLALSTVASDRYFWLLFTTMFTGLIAGFIVNTNMTRLFSGPDARVGVRAVFLFAIASATGRILWGFFFDRLKSSTAIKLNLLLQGVLLLSAPWLLDTAGRFWFFAFAAGFNYGGLLVIHASSSARHWGGEHVGQVYGWLSGSNIPAAFAPVAAGLAYDHWRSFNCPLLATAVLLILIAGVYHLQTRRISDHQP